MQIKIRVLKYNELSEALKLIESTFMLFVATDYMDQGVQSFLGFISDEKNIRAMIFFGAFEDGELKGVMAVNADRYLLSVCGWAKSKSWNCKGAL